MAHLRDYWCVSIDAQTGEIVEQYYGQVEAPDNVRVRRVIPEEMKRDNVLYGFSTLSAERALQQARITYRSIPPTVIHQEVIGNGRTPEETLEIIADRKDTLRKEYGRNRRVFVTHVAHSEGTQITITNKKQLG